MVTVETQSHSPHELQPSHSLKVQLIGASVQQLQPQRDGYWHPAKSRSSPFWRKFQPQTVVTGAGSHRLLTEIRSRTRTHAFVQNVKWISTFVRRVTLRLPSTAGSSFIQVQMLVVVPILFSLPHVWQRDNYSEFCACSQAGQYSFPWSIISLRLDHFGSFHFVKPFNT